MQSTSPRGTRSVAKSGKSIKSPHNTGNRTQNKQQRRNYESDEKQQSSYLNRKQNETQHTSKTRQRLHLYTQATLGAGNMRLAVTKPDKP